MIVYSDKLTRADLDEIAEGLGLVLYNSEDEFHGAKRRRISFTLRPGTDCPDYRRAARLNPYGGGKGWRRVWAVSWDGHYDYMDAMLSRDPSAEIKSALAHWRGHDDFRQRAPETGNMNMGSQVSPLPARRANVAAMKAGA